MKIGLDAGALCAVKSGRFGTYRYTEELIWALKEYATSLHEYHGFTFCTPACDGGIRMHTAVPSFGWTRFALPLALGLQEIQIFLAVNQKLPAFFPGKLIAISHGLSFRAFPQLYFRDSSRLNTQLEDYTKRADHIIVSSVRVRDEMLRYYPGTEGRVQVLPFGIRPYTTAIQRHSGRPYFLFAGSDQPVKNLPFLLAAFRMFKTQESAADVELILAGTNIQELPEGVRQIGHVDREQLYNLYSNAQAYVTASIYESFNYPVLEALVAGCPVIGTTSAVIPEMQSAVHLANTKASFAAALYDAYRGRIAKPDPIRIARKFSWRSYVHSLESLFV